MIVDLWLLAAAFCFYLFMYSIVSNWLAPVRCSHTLLRSVYGDEIIFAANWARHQCLDCGVYLFTGLPVGDRVVGEVRVVS